jgi:hypothetical protein
MSQEYEDALAKAGWHVDEFELCQQELKDQNKTPKVSALVCRMYATPKDLWQQMENTAKDIDLYNERINSYPHMSYAKLKAILESMNEDELAMPVVVSHPEGGIAPVYGIDPFQDCGVNNIALVASYEDDDAIHPVYMKGVVEHYKADNDVVLYDCVNKQS